MPTYTWKCAVCATEIDVERPMRLYDVPPEACSCGSTELTKLISTQGKPILKGDGWFRDTVTSTGRSNGR